MKFFSSFSIRKKLLFLIFVAVLPSLAIILFSGIEQRENEIVSTKRDILHLVQSLSAQQEQVAASTRQMLKMLAQLPEVQKIDAKACNRIFRDIQEQNPLYAVIAAVTPDGNMFALSEPFTPGSVNLADRKHIRDALRTRDFSVGEYIVGKVVKDPTIIYAYPVLDKNRKLIAIVSAGIKFDKYKEFVAQLNLPKGSVMSISDYKNITLYRLPEREDTPSGTPLRSQQKLPDYNKEGFYEGIGRDNVPRIYAYKRLWLRNNEPYYLGIYVSVDKNLILREANIKLVYNLGFLGIACLFAMLLTWIAGNSILVEPLHKLAIATQRFGRGELNVRTDLPPREDELGRLAKSFDTMAVMLEMEDLERRKAEVALREVSTRLDIIVEHLPDATFVIDADRKVVAWNRAIEQITGVPKEEMIGKGNYEYAIPFYGERRPIIIDLAFLPDEEFEKREYDAVHRSGDTLYGEVYVPKTYGGKGAYLSATASRLRDTVGNVTGAIECIRDISERKQAEETLQANEERLRAVFDSVQDFIFIKDVNCRYLVINNFFQKRFQIDPSVFLGHTDAEIPIFENKDMTGAIVQDTDAMVLRGETAYSELMHRVCGTLLTLEILKTPIRDGQRNITGICGVSRDITERRKVEEEKRGLEERLNRAEKMESLGTLAGGVAHDLNNVLGIVVGYAEMLMDEMDEENPMRDDMKKILEGGNRSAAIVHDLLTLARRGVQTKKTVNLNATITDCQKLPEFEKVFSYNLQVKLQTDLELDLLNIMGSPVHLGKTIINLAANAVEAMPNGGVLKIATTNQYLDMPIHGYDNIREGDYVVLTISDTGEGILERDIKRIFEPFYTKKIMGKSGTGLGLAVVWGTIKDHNGYINVESTEGKGTTFTLYFPVTRDEIASDLISVSMSEYMGRGETILVVDDINRQRELASRMLSKLNYRVSTVASGEESIEYLRTNKADLIVLDMIMDPGIDGLETYEKILKFNPVQKAVIVSGFSESDRVKEAQKIGAGAYVPKPYVLERLGIAVRKELDKK